MSDSHAVTEDSRGDWHRNIVSLRSSVDIFRELASDPADASILIAHELATKPTREPQPIISRPFDDAVTYDPLALAIQWPFEHPTYSRYSAGAYGVWYGGRTFEATIYETVYHFRRNTLSSEVARETKKPIIQERRVHLVHCGAALVDLRAQCATDARLVDPCDYSYCQSLGAGLRSIFLPGIMTLSARLAKAEIAAVFVREALSNPRDVCYLTYNLDAATGRVTVERTPGVVEWVIERT
ncbi:MAG TPA: RES family NAD+ phosphorylase [Steroidobacter sp.]|nr:RES family NAD+ phosphorylase [Steroidobacter sp.]